MRKERAIKLLIAGLFLSVTALSQAASVIVPNGDFEDYANIGDGTTGAGWSSFPSAAGGSITAALTINDEFWSNPSSFGSGWQDNGTQPSNGKYGLQHPSNSQQSHEADGTLSAPFQGYFIGFVNLTEGDATGASAGSIQSGSLGQLAAGTYTLTLGVGSRASSSWNDLSYSLSLVAGGLTPGVGSSGGSVLGTPATATIVPTTLTLPDTSLDLTYTLTVNPGDAVIGEDYAIRLDVANLGTRDGAASPNGTSDFTQANFDNVRLDFTPVPEPASLVLLAFGALMLGAYSIRRRQP